MQARTLARDLIEIRGATQALLAISELDPKTVKIANAIMKSGTPTGFIREYVLGSITAEEFTKVMESINDRLKLV